MGRRPFGPPRGEPAKPLLEAFIVFIAFYLASYVSAAAPSIVPSRADYHLMIVAVNLPRALLVLYLMATGDGLASFGIGRYGGIDPIRGFLTALGAFILILIPGFAFSALGIENPLFAQARPGPKPGLELFPLLLASSMATGYCEELFFRSYLLRRLGQAGLPVLWAGIASSLVFGGGHGYQGIVGLVSGCLLGLFFAWRWNESRNIHEIAIGHGLFDAAVFSILVYS